MKTACEIEQGAGLHAGSVKIATNFDGVRVIEVDGSEFNDECARWALRCVCTRKGFDAVIDSGIATLSENQRTAARAQWDHGDGKLSRSDVLVLAVLCGGCV